MMRRLFLLLLLFLTLILGVNAYKYNDTYMDFYLDANGWCPGIEIEFTVYNESEYEIREEIKNNLCLEGETPSEDNCLNFTMFKDVEYKIYSGPLKSMPVIASGKTDSNSHFKYTFPDTNQHLVELTLSGNYNDYHKTFEVWECTHSLNDTELDDLATSRNYSLSFLDEKLNLDVFGTDAQSKDNFTVKFLTNLDIIAYPLIENKLKIFKISSDFDYTRIEVRQTLDDVDLVGKNLKFVKLDLETKNWTQISDFIFSSNVFTFLNASYDTFVIYYEDEVVEPEPVVEEIVEEEPVVEEVVEEVSEIQQTETLVDDNQLLDGDNSSDEENLEASSSASSSSSSPVSSSGTNWTVIIGIVIVVVVIIVLIKMMSGRKVKEPEVKEEVVPEPQINSYTIIYENTKKYVKQYKDSYEKDQIYRVLKEANIPRDIIDKVFNEEF